MYWYENEVWLKYMNKTREFYRWPNNEDVSVEPQGAICQYLNPPTLEDLISTNRNQYFSFDPVPVLDHIRPEIGVNSHIPTRCNRLQWLHIFFGVLAHARHFTSCIEIFLNMFFLKKM